MKYRKGDMVLRKHYVATGFQVQTSKFVPSRTILLYRKAFRIFLCITESCAHQFGSQTAFKMTARLRKLQAHCVLTIHVEASFLVDQKPTGWRY